MRLGELQLAASIQERGGKFQLRIVHKILTKPFFGTYETRPIAEGVRDRLVSMFDQGIVPIDLLDAPPKAVDDPLVVQVIRSYREAVHLTESDQSVLSLVALDVVNLRMSGLDFMWADAWVKRLKLERNIAPSTIRKRVGSLARCVDWHQRRKGDVGARNPLRLLPRGYSVATPVEAQALLAAGKDVKRDVTRDRRLSAEEVERIEDALKGIKRSDRERALAIDPAFTLLFYLILDTGLRLFEAYRIQVGKIDLTRRLISVDGSKGHRGQIKPRVVPLKGVLVDRLRVALDGRDKGDLLFPFWNGSPEHRIKATRNLGHRFKVLFDYARVTDFTEHDLRHEATCRWIELRDRSGRWAFSDMEICRIMGWKDTRMLLRYASLRGEDLADRLL